MVGVCRSEENIDARSLFKVNPAAARAAGLSTRGRVLNALMSLERPKHTGTLFVRRRYATFFLFCCCLCETSCTSDYAVSSRPTPSTTIWISTQRTALFDVTNNLSELDIAPRYTSVLGTNKKSQATINGVRSTHLDLYILLTLQRDSHAGY